MAEHGDTGEQSMGLRLLSKEVAESKAAAIRIEFVKKGRWRQVVCPISNEFCDGCPGGLLREIAKGLEFANERGRVRAMLDDLVAFEESDQEDGCLSMEFEVGGVGNGGFQVFALHDATDRVHLFGFFDPADGKRRNFVLCFGYIGRRKRNTNRWTRTVGKAAEKIYDWWGSQ